MNERSIVKSAVPELTECELVDPARAALGGYVDKHLLVVMAHCLPGPQDDFNEWYTKVHLPEVLNVDGIVTAQRFVRSELETPQEGSPYLALYSIESDDLDTVARKFRAEMSNKTIHPGLDRSRSRSVFYSAISAPVRA